MPFVIIQSEAEGRIFEHNADGYANGNSIIDFPKDGAGNFFLPV